MTGRGLTLILLGLALVLAACDTDAPSVIAFEAIPDSGDAENGALLFEQSIGGTAPCASCHMEGAAGAPHIEAGYDALAADRVEGQSAREYTFYAITEPAQHIVDGYGNAMPNQYDENLTEQQIADLIEYMLGL